jgi:hypothetical protein
MKKREEGLLFKELFYTHLYLDKNKIDRMVLLKIAI